MRKLTLLFALIAGWQSLVSAQESTTDTLVVGAGCFWCVEAIYDRVPGVVDVVSGYAGGTEENPTYQQVGAHKTGHAEVVKITFDPKKTSIKELLKWFWKSHDPTTSRGVAPDWGPSYRSILLYKDDAQKQAIEESKAEVSKNYDKPIATEIAQLTKFWPAEDYHQDYAKKHPDDRYVKQVSLPRVKETGLNP